jgi:hypothetical protein
VSSMRIMLSTLAAITFVSPFVGRAQSASLDTQGSESAPSVQALVEANRAGISNERQKRDRSSITRAGIDTSSRVSRGRLVEAGAIVGLLSGAGVGAVVGLVMDPAADTMIGATPFLTAFGAAIGLITGLLLGLVLPTKQ